MPECFILARGEVSVTRTGRSHAERFVEFLGARLLPFQPVWFNRRDGAFGHAKIRVSVMRTETAIGMLISQTKQNFRARKAEILEQIPSVIWQAAPMRVHVANSDFARDPGIEHLE